MAMSVRDVRAKLEASQRQLEDRSEEWPAVRLFTPLSRGVWLLSRIDMVDSDKAFGLCDDGSGQPLLGHVSLRDLASRFGHLSVRWDVQFKADRSLGAYAAEAQTLGRISS
jgi:hypothetical protein